MGRRLRATCPVVAMVALVGANGAHGRQGSPPDFGIEFVIVGSPGNPAYTENRFGAPFAPGRGSVAYVYRIGRLETSTAQWMKFVNTFSTQSDDLAFFAEPSTWGAVLDPDYGGPGNRWILLPGAPDAGVRPVFGIQWREAALYCNWLHNGQSSDLSSLQNGAYDASTFTRNPDGTYNDQRRHHPGATFWIPTFDEWIKSSHFDPNRYGPGQGGWWQYSHRSDLAPVPGLPGVGETSAGYELPNFGHYDIPLGAYATTLSPWGLLDATGGAQEWTEETFEEVYQGERRYRAADGGFAGPFSIGDLDHVERMAGLWPNDQGWAGLRIAAPVPSPSAFVVVVLSTLHGFTRRSR